MIKFNLVMMLAIIATALYLVNVQYESRHLTSELDKARSQARSLQIDNERLAVQVRAQATPQRVERLAQDKLQMRTVTPAITHYVSYSALVNMGKAKQPKTSENSALTGQQPAGATP